MWTGLQVLHFCFSVSATQRKPLGTVILNVLHLPHTHKKSQSDTWMTLKLNKLVFVLRRLQTHNIFSDISMCFIWWVPVTLNCPVLLAVRVQLEGLRRVRHCHIKQQSESTFLLDVLVSYMLFKQWILLYCVVFNYQYERKKKCSSLFNKKYFFNAHRIYVSIFHFIRVKGSYLNDC